MKRILLILSMLTCLGLMTACGSAQDSSQAADEAASEATYRSNIEQLLGQIVALDDATIDSYLESGQLQEGLYQSLSSWKEMKGELGDFQEVTDGEVTIDDDQTTVVLNINCSKREGTYTVTIDSEGQLVSGSFDKVYTTGEIFKKAALNTLMGMGTVFAVLIFISFIISLFKYIPDIQAKFTKKAETQVVAEPAAEEPVYQEPADELVDDGQLVAVITAAICASMASEGKPVSKDTLIVKSIRRSRK